MRRHSSSMMGAAAAALVLLSGAAGTAGAQGKGHGKANGHGRDDAYGVEDGRRVPPGLAKKPGGMPPGQYRKRYAPNDGVVVLRDVFGRHGYTVDRVTPYGQSQYVYYRLPNGTVRRAVVSPGTDQLVFANVPAALLGEVLARLR